MTLFRTVDGEIEWFNTNGDPINQDGSPRGGPSLADLGGPDGTEPPGFSNPGATPSAPPPPAIVTPPLPSSFANLNIQVTNAATGAALVGATVLISPDFGNGTQRTTDGNGFANFGVRVGYDVEINILAGGFTNNDHVIHISDTSDHWYAIALVPLVAPPPTPPPVPPPTGQPPGVPTQIVLKPGGSITPLDPPTSTSGATPADPTYTHAAVELRGGVPSFTAQSFSAFDIPAFGVSPGGIILGIVSGLFGLFSGNSGGADVTRLSGLVQNMGQFVLQLAQTLADDTTRSVHTDTQSGNIFETILGGVLGPIINALASVIRGGAQDLTKLFGPITDGLKNLLSLVRRIYKNWLLPILKVIDGARQLLRVLEAFHIKGAAEADAALGRLEGKLSAPLLLTIKQLNKVSGVVNQIVTLDGALQRVTLVKSLTTHPTCVQRAIDQAPMAAAGTWPDTLPPLETTGDNQMLLSNAALLVDDQGPWADEYSAWRADLEAQLLA